jgi:hypothetical protein
MNLRQLASHLCYLAYTLIALHYLGNDVIWLLVCVILLHLVFPSTRCLCWRGMSLDRKRIDYVMLFAVDEARNIHFKDCVLVGVVDLSSECYRLRNRRAMQAE